MCGSRPRERDCEEVIGNRAPIARGEAGRGGIIQPGEEEVGGITSTCTKT